MYLLCLQLHNLAVTPPFFMIQDALESSKAVLLVAGIAIIRTWRNKQAQSIIIEVRFARSMVSNCCARMIFLCQLLIVSLMFDVMLEKCKWWCV
jgi:hypothetical protein